jgi:hypothetical protein
MTMLQPNREICLKSNGEMTKLFDKKKKKKQRGKYHVEWWTPVISYLLQSFKAERQQFYST